MASDAAQFWLPEAQLGIHPDSGGLLRLPKCLPERLATEKIYTGRRLSATEALQFGLVSRHCDGENLLECALDLAHAIAASAPLAIAAAKDIMRATRNLGVEAGFAVMRSGTIPTYQRAIQSEDASAAPLTNHAIDRLSGAYSLLCHIGLSIPMLPPNPAIS